MAEKTTAAPAAPTTTKTDSKPAASAPSGFNRAAPLDDAPWYELAAENTLHARVECWAVMQTEPPRMYYQVKLLRPVKVRVGRGEGAKVEEMPEGSIVNVGETHKTKVLRDRVASRMDAGGAYEIWINPLKKRKVGTSGRSIWLMDVQTKELRVPTSEVRPIKAEGETDEETPF